MIKRHEGNNKRGSRHYPYRDTTGHLTIGYGRNLDGKGISDCEAEMMLTTDISEATANCQQFPWFEELSQHRQFALIDMCFNLGIYKLKKFKKMLKALEEKDWQKAHDEALDSLWAEQVGQRAIEVAELLLRG